MFHDVSQIEEMAQQLTWQASHDPLTGLVNRREFERRLAELLNSARSENKQHALMYMDLDNFKTVNDTCGHAAGDELPRQLTTVMQARMRGSDTLARVGGDEFGVLLESCSLDQAVRITNGLREAVRDFRFVWQDKTFGVGASVGLVTIDGAMSVSRVLATGDATCYEAKSRGRDRVLVYRALGDQLVGRISAPAIRKRRSRQTGARSRGCPKAAASSIRAGASARKCGALGWCSRTRRTTARFRTPAVLPAY